MYNAQSTADIIKKLLIDRKITGKQMAQKCGLGVNVLSNIRRGDVKSIETFEKIADFLNCSIDYLLGKTSCATETNEYKNNESFKVTEHEQKVLSAYRSQPEMQPAVDKLLGVEQEHRQIKKLA